MSNAHLIIPAFIAGLITFLAPCTLPLVPAYLGFISGASAKDLLHPEKSKHIRLRVIKNGLFYVFGFSAVFILLGVLFGIGGSALIHYRDVLSRVGGVFIIFFGLYLIGVFEKIKPVARLLTREFHLPLIKHLHPGTPGSSLLFGATFAFGWTPCVGPILGSVLLLASTSATVVQGATLLTVFSLGLAVPFMLLAVGIAHASETIKKLSHILPYISTIGGIFLLILGMMLLTNTISLWLGWSYEAFKFIGYDRLLEYL